MWRPCSQQLWPQLHQHNWKLQLWLSWWIQTFIRWTYMSTWVLTKSLAFIIHETNNIAWPVCMVRLSPYVYSTAVRILFQKCIVLRKLHEETFFTRVRSAEYVGKKASKKVREKRPSWNCIRVATSVENWRTFSSAYIVSQLERLADDNVKQKETRLQCASERNTRASRELKSNTNNAVQSSWRCGAFISDFTHHVCPQGISWSMLTLAMSTIEFRIVTLASLMDW